MALSLYRKYRPQTFDDVVGQEHIEQTLKNAVVTKSVSSAYLFCGPRGTGKTTTARILAKALLCEQAPTDNPDGTCSRCVEISEGVHPDVYELDAASRTGVENVREEIIGRVQFAPTRGTFKIYIIDEVHMLSTAAFNALLKTLEEPPSHVVFVLCTTDPHKVPPTILSRCQRFDFHRLSEKQITQRLQEICDFEGFTAEPAALDLIAQRSQGGMRDAINSLEQVAVFGGGKVSFTAAENMLGEVGDNQLFNIAALMADRDIVGCFEWVAAFSQSGTDIAQFVRDLTMHIRNLYVASMVDKSPALPEILDTDTDKVELYRDQAGEFGSSDRLAHILLVLGDLTTELRSAANARLSMEIALTRIVRPQSDLTLEALAVRLEALEKGIVVPVAALQQSAQQQSPKALETATAPVVDSRVSAKSGTSSRAVASESAQAGDDSAPTIGSIASTKGNTESDLANASNVQQLWLRLEREVKARRRVIATLLGGSRAHINPTTGGLLIELPTSASFAKTSLERAENQEFLREMVKQVFGKPLSLSYILGPPFTASNPRAEAVSLESIDVTGSSGIPADDDSISGDSGYDVNGSSDSTTEVFQAEAEGSGSTETSIEDILANSFGAAITIEEYQPPRNTL